MSWVAEPPAYLTITAELETLLVLPQEIVGNLFGCDSSFGLSYKTQDVGAGKAHLEMTKQDFGVQSKVPYLHRSLGCRRRPQLDLISSLKTSTEGLHHTWVRNFSPVKATTVTTEWDVHSCGLETFKVL